MIHADKVAAVKEMNEAFNRAPHVVVATFRGLTVNGATELRSKIRGIGGTYKVVKNRLAKRAAEGTPVEKVADRLSGPCAVVTHESDPVALAKVLSEFVKSSEGLELVAGVIDGREVVESDAVKHLASLPGLPELRAQLLSLIQTPATTLVRLTSTPASQLARAIGARRDQMEGES